MGLDNPFLKLEMQPVPYSNLAHSEPKELLVPVSAMQGRRRREDESRSRATSEPRLDSLPSQILYLILLMWMQRGRPVLSKDQP